MLYEKSLPVNHKISCAPPIFGGAAALYQYTYCVSPTGGRGGNRCR